MDDFDDTFVSLPMGAVGNSEQVAVDKKIRYLGQGGLRYDEEKTLA